jgi:NADH-quinone oxidoreductase subunit K
MAVIPTAHVLIVAGALVCIGAFGVLLRRNLLLSLEVMLNGAALAFVGAGAHWQQPDGQIFVIFIMAMAAAEVAVALALILLIFRRSATLDADRLDVLRG